MNEAPVSGFEHDVGNRTTIRSIPNLELLWPTYEQEEVLLTREIAKNSLAEIQAAVNHGKELSVYQFGEPDYKELLHATPTSGFWTIAVLRNFCDKLFLIGFNEKDGNYDDLRYHYWEEEPSFKKLAEEQLKMIPEGAPTHDFNFEHKFLKNISTPVTYSR